MRTIKELVKNEKKVYVYLRNKSIEYRFMSDAEQEGITYADGVKPTERPVDEIMALHDDGTICFLGWAGRMAYHYSKGTIKRIDYEKYVQGLNDYLI